MQRSEDNIISFLEEIKGASLEPGFREIHKLFHRIRERDDDILRRGKDGLRKHFETERDAYEDEASEFEKGLKEGFESRVKAMVEGGKQLTVDDFNNWFLAQLGNYQAVLKKRKKKGATALAKKDNMTWTEHKAAVDEDESALLRIFRKIRNTDDLRVASGRYQTEINAVAQAAHIGSKEPVSDGDVERDLARELEREQETHHEREKARHTIEQGEKQVSKETTELTRKSKKRKANGI